MKLDTLIFGGITHQHVNMIGHKMALYNIYSFGLA